MATTVGRKSMPLSKIGETHTWFLIHRGVMILVLMLTISGVTLIFVAREGWSESAGPHAYLGPVSVFTNFVILLLKSNESCETISVTSSKFPTYKTRSKESFVWH